MTPRNAALAALAALGVLVAVLLPDLPAAARAGTSPLLYDYEFRGTTGTVPNSAPLGPVAPLTLIGTWTAVPAGVRFRGNTSGHESVAYGRPATGYSLDEPARAAVGFGVRIVYDAPATGTCFPDTPNVTQIGRYSAQTTAAQLKLQLSSCTTSSTQVMMECRIAGALTASDAPPLVSTLPLVNGDPYNVSCVKAPDGASGTTTITLTVTDLNSASGGQSVTDTFTVPDLGYLRTNEYITAGNTYPLPPPAQNTDQLNGVVTRAVYCAGGPLNVSSCLALHLPAR